jgi:hypothetical protein
MRILFFLGVLIALSAPTGAEPFASYGPIDCSSPLPISYTLGQKQISIEVNDRGTIRTFIGTGESKEIPYRLLPKGNSMSFGPKGIVTCTSRTLVRAICQSYATKRGWGGSCEYCTLDEKSGTNKCYRAWGQVLETTGSRKEAIAVPR